MLAQLVPVDGSKPITLTRDVIVVGRKLGLCDLIIERPSVSKLHCVLVKTDGLLFVRDLGSTNGTKVNGQRVTRGALLPGDELAFASVKFRVHLGPDPKEEDRPDERTEMIEPSSVQNIRRELPEEPEFASIDDPGEADYSVAVGSDDTSDSDVRLLEDDSAG